MTRFRRLPILLAAAALVALVGTGCIGVQEKSTKTSVPGGLGSPHIAMTFCTVVVPQINGPSADPGESPCGASNEKTREGQPFVAFAITPGYTPPQTIVAPATKGGGPALTFTRNATVEAAFQTEVGNAENGWPPAGTAIVGYLGNAVNEPEGANIRWPLDATFTQPNADDGGPFGGAFVSQVGVGWRRVEAGLPANRPVSCAEKKQAEPEKGVATTSCTSSKETLATTGITNASIATAPPATGLLGGTGTVSFPIAYASGATPPPSLALSATTTLGGASATTPPAYIPTGIAPPSFRAAPASLPVSVAVPKNAKPGTYNVTVIATAPGGAKVTQTGKINVAKAAPKLSGLKLNKAKGTATIEVSLLSGGVLTVFGKNLVKIQRKPAAAKKVTVALKPKGALKSSIFGAGKATAEVKFKFKPTSGIAETKAKSVTFKAN